MMNIDEHKTTLNLCSMRSSKQQLFHVNTLKNLFSQIYHQLKSTKDLDLDYFNVSDTCY